MCGEVGVSQWVGVGVVVEMKRKREESWKCESGRTFFDLFRPKDFSSRDGESSFFFWNSFGILNPYFETLKEKAKIFPKNKKQKRNSKTNKQNKQAKKI